MTKSEFVKAVAKRTGTTQSDAEEFVFASIDIIQKELAEGGSVDFPGFGKFYVRERAEREGKVPGTGEIVIIPAATVPGFKPGKLLKEAVN